MDKAIEQYLDNLANKCLSSPSFSALGEDEKQEVKQKIRNHFANLTIDSLLDKLTVDQFNEIENMDTKSKEFEEKIQLFAAKIPNFAFFLEQKLTDEATRISQTGHVPS